MPPITNTSGTLSITWTKSATYLGVYGTDFVIETSTSLTGTWGDTEAESVWVDGSTIYVAGWGRNLT